MHARVLAFAVVLAARTATADPTAALRDANAAAIAGDWARVAALVQPLFAQPLDPRDPLDRADLAEAHRLEGMVLFFAHREVDAETHFVAYLKLDLDGHLDPALYPPEVVGFFDEIRAKHSAELRALRPRPHRHLAYNFLPPAGQFQNGDTVKGWLIVGAYGTFAIANVASYLAVRSWCHHVSGPAGSSLVCDDSSNHDHGARIAQTIEIASGVGLALTYVYGLYDGVNEYRRKEHAMPFAAPAAGGGVVGLTGSF